MKKTLSLITGFVALLIISSCQKVSEIDFEKVLDLNISLEKDVLQTSNTNMLTLSIENTSSGKIVIPRSSFLIEFTSYSGSVKRTFYIDPFQEMVSSEVLAQKDLVIKGNSVLSKTIDLSKILSQVNANMMVLLPVDDYTVNLIITFEPEISILENKEIIRSNYEDIRIKG